MPILRQKMWQQLHNREFHTVGRFRGPWSWRQLLLKWGYRRCEDIVWIKTNKVWEVINHTLNIIIIVEIRFSSALVLLNSCLFTLYVEIMINQKRIFANISTPTNAILAKLVLAITFTFVYMLLKNHFRLLCTNVK